MNETLLAEFDTQLELYKRVTKKTEVLVCDLLDSHSVTVHSVTSRTKERDSLARKMSRKVDRYTCLDEITDICGIRIITYLESDVGKVADLLGKEFELDEINSINKRLGMDPDRFGYLSTHQVVQLNSSRANLHEYRWFAGRKIEIQIRSILQHAWAEIEHDLGYKSKLEVPKHVRRRFSRLAGLLELADSEFDGINVELSKYYGEVENQVLIAPNSTEIDKPSLIAFINSNVLLSQLDSQIAAWAGWIVIRDDDQVSRNIEMLNFVGLSTVGQLENGLTFHATEIREFAKMWLSREDRTGHETKVYRGISIFYLCYVLLGASGSKSRIESYFRKFSIGPASDFTDDDDDQNYDGPQRIINVYSLISKSE